MCAVELLCYPMTDRPVNNRRRFVSYVEKDDTANIWQIIWISCYMKLQPQLFSLQLFKRGLESRPDYADLNTIEKALDEIFSVLYLIPLLWFAWLHLSQSCQD